MYTFHITKPNKIENFLETITKIQNVLKVWRMRSLVLVYLSMMIKVPVEIIVELEKIQKRFI